MFIFGRLFSLFLTSLSLIFLFSCQQDAVEIHRLSTHYSSIYDYQNATFDDHDNLYVYTYDVLNRRSFVKQINENGVVENLKTEITVGKVLVNGSGVKIVVGANCEYEDRHTDTISIQDIENDRINFFSIDSLFFDNQNSFITDFKFSNILENGNYSIVIGRNNIVCNLVTSSDFELLESKLYYGNSHDNIFFIKNFNNEIYHAYWQDGAFRIANISTGETLSTSYYNIVDFGVTKNGDIVVLAPTNNEIELGNIEILSKKHGAYFLSLPEVSQLHIGFYRDRFGEAKMGENLFINKKDDIYIVVKRTESKEYEILKLDLIENSFNNIGDTYRKKIDILFDSENNVYIIQQIDSDEINDQDISIDIYDDNGVAIGTWFIS